MVPQSVKLLAAIFIISSFVLYLSWDKTEQNIVPLDNNFSLSFSTYHEALDTNFSISSSSLNQDKTEVNFNYKLTNDTEVIEPFAALFFYSTEKTSPFFKFSKFNSLKLNIRSLRGKRIPITFTLDYKGITTNNKVLTNMPFTYVLEYNGLGEYIIPLSKFEIPSWWLRMHKLKKEELTNLDFDRVNYLVIGSCQLLERGIEDKTTIMELKLFNDKTINMLLYMTVLIVSLIVVVLVYYLNRRKIVISYTPLEIGEKESNTKLNQLILLVANNYMNPDLNITFLQQELGGSSREIGNLFKQKLNTSFKGYLNTVRLAEVKRLLIKSELSISEIGYNTGYSSISHFNRVFKLETGMSPKDYRDQNMNK